MRDAGRMGAASLSASASLRLCVRPRLLARREGAGVERPAEGALALDALAPGEAPVAARRLAQHPRERDPQPPQRQVVEEDVPVALEGVQRVAAGSLLSLKASKAAQVQRMCGHPGT
jgi:hypothetical protein